MNHRRTLAYALTFLGLWLLAVIMLWPAHWLAAQLSQATQDTWRLEQVSGRLWQGSGLLMHRHSRQHPWQALQVIGWQLHWPRILSGQLPLSLRLEHGQMELMLSPDSLEIRHLEALLPAHALFSALPGALSRYHWHGDVRLDGTHYRCHWTPQHCTGQINLLWQQAAVNEVPGPALGDYRVELRTAEQLTHLRLATLNGRLQLQGQGEINAQGQLSFQGIAQLPASAQHPDAKTTLSLADGRLHELLATLGRPLGRGQYRIEYREP